VSTILILAEPVSFSRLHAWAIGAGLSCVADFPITGRFRTATFGGDRGHVLWFCRAGSRHAVLAVDGEGEEAIAREARAAFPMVAVADLVARLDGASSSLGRVTAASDLGALVFLASSPENDQAVAALGRALLDDDRAVRYTAARVLGEQMNRPVLSLYTAAAERHPDLRPVRDFARETCEAAEAGTLYDGPTDSWWKLEQRAREGVEKGQWKRVAKAADDLLAQSADNAKGLYYRGLAYEAQGELPLALAYLGAARARIAIRLSAVKRDDEGETAGDDAEERALLPTLEEKVAELRARPVPAARWEAAREPILARLSAWWKDQSTLSAGAAEALHGLDAAIEAPLVFLSGCYRLDVAKVERALTLAPGSLAVELALAKALSRTDPAASRARYEGILSRLRTGEAAEPGGAAALIARFDKDPATLAGVLEALTVMTQQARDRPRALELADELVKVNPNSLMGWQIRAWARLFELRYEEAAEAYAEGIREVTRVYDLKDRGWTFLGTDPRPQMHFNRACAFGRLGRKEEALDALRAAVRGDEKFAEQALTDDWLECLWGTPELEAIARKDPRALATQEELSPPFIERLVSRCSELFHRGEAREAIAAGERAVELAGFAGDPLLSARALASLGHALTFSGQAGRAVELLARAVTLVEGASAADRATVIHDQGSVLQEHGDLAGAERAYRLALSLRREA
jgi:tetratricopeptide (TPR) repeat protein